MKLRGAPFLLLLAACSKSVSGTTGGDAGVGDATVDASLDAPMTEAASCTGTFGAMPWAQSPKNPLFAAGRSDPDGGVDLSIGDPFVLHDPDDGLYKAWWSAGIGVTFSDPNNVLVLRYAESPDGLAWTVQDEPALSSHVATGDWDYTNVETPTVIKNPAATPDRRFMLWYSGANSKAKVETAGFPWYQIGLAFSPDGKHFTRMPASESAYGAAPPAPYTGVDGLVLFWKDALPALKTATDGVLADPSVVLIDGTFHLWMSSYAESAPHAPLAYGISHATSTDGIHWTDLRPNPLASLNGGAAPTVVWNASACFYEMWFSRDTPADKAAVPAAYFETLGFWHAISGDAVTWTVPGTKRDLTWDPDAGFEAYGPIVGPTALLEDAGYRFYYVAWGKGTFPPGFLVPLQDAGLASWPTGGLLLNLATR
jgi:hypothetical protein